MKIDLDFKKSLGIQLRNLPSMRPDLFELNERFIVIGAGHKEDKTGWGRFWVVFKTTTDDKKYKLDGQCRFVDGKLELYRSRFVPVSK